MKRLSLWGRQHPWTARLIIVLCYVLLSITGFLVGDLLLALGVEINAVWIYLLVFSTLVALALYPSRRQKHRLKNFYAWQKTCDGILGATSFLIVVSAANLQGANDTPLQLTAALAVVPSAPHSIPGITVETTEKNPPILKTWKRKLSTLMQKIRTYHRKLATADQVIETIVALIVAAGAIFLVLILSCSVACSAGPALGLVVLIGGLTLIIMLLVRSLRRIQGKPPRKKEPEPKVVAA